MSEVLVAALGVLREHSECARSDNNIQCEYRELPIPLYLVDKCRSLFLPLGTRKFALSAK